jgi:hypothetical protein
MKYLDKIQRGGKIYIKYNGTVQNGVAHGKGIMIFNNNNNNIKYVGYFENGKGAGRTYNLPGYNDFRFFTGYFDNNNGLPHGIGFLYLASEHYMGEFKDGKYHGYGRIENHVKKTTIDRKFENGEEVGTPENKSVVKENLDKIFSVLINLGKNLDKNIECDSCDTYEGEYPTGKGTIKFKNGDTYIGDYPTGKGVLKFENGDKYIGEYPTGKGTMKFENGDVYEGEYPTGNGTMTFENGDKRIVKLQNGKQTMSFLKKKVNSEQVDEIKKNVNGEQVDEIKKKVKQIKEEFNKINFEQLSVYLQSNYKKLKSSLEHDNLTNDDLKKAEDLLKSIQAPQSRSLGIKALAGVAGVAGLSYYLYNKFKKSSKRRAKSSSSKSSSRTSNRRSKHSEQSSLS